MIWRWAIAAALVWQTTACAEQPNADDAAKRENVVAAATPPVGTAAEIPPAFRGRWDDRTEDGCREREAALLVTAREIYNFEVGYAVTSVSVGSPRQIEVRARTIDAEPQSEDTFSLRLTAPDQLETDPSTYPLKRCPVERR